MAVTLKPILPVVAVAALMAGLLAHPRTAYAATLAVTTTADAAHTTPLNGNLHLHAGRQPLHPAGGGPGGQLPWRGPAHDQPDRGGHVRAHGAGGRRVRGGHG